MKLYGYWRSSSSWRVRIALEHKALEWEYVPVHLVKDGGEQRTEWFEGLNPSKQVPVLEFEAGGTTRRLGQSMAILDYLEQTHPDPAMLPADPYLRARAIQLAEIVNSGIQPLQNLAVIQTLKAMDQDAKGWCKNAIAAGLHAYEAILAETAGTYSVGDEVSWADACLVPQLYNARRFDLDLSSFDRILRVEQACMELDAFRASHPSEQPDATE